MIPKSVAVEIHPQACLLGSIVSERYLAQVCFLFFFFSFCAGSHFLKFIGHKDPEELIANKEMRALLQ